MKTVAEIGRHRKKTTNNNIMLTKELLIYFFIYISTKRAPHKQYKNISFIHDLMKKQNHEKV